MQYNTINTINFRLLDGIRGTTTNTDAKVVYLLYLAVAVLEGD